MDLKFIQAGVLEIAYYETGPSDGPVAILLHGFPYDAHSYTEVMATLADKGMRCIAPFLRGYGQTRFLSDDTPRSGEQAALGADVLALLDALSIEQATLAGFDWGGRAACIVAALWPERVTGLVSCGVGYNIQNIARSNDPAPAEEEARYWYIYLFHTERGRASLSHDRYGFCKFIWRLWSKTWAFDEATYARSARAFENPDFIDIVLHSYQHRFGGVAGDPAVADIEASLARQPSITVPTIVVQGTDDGVDPPSASESLRAKFASSYERRVLQNVGHNPPQEAPDAFGDAVLRVAGWSGQKL
ncbi:MAG: alpha/beta hydrolase [Pseudomonadota bacterium]